MINFEEVLRLSVRIGILNPDGLARGTQRALEEFVKNLERQDVFVSFSLYSNRIPEADIMIGTYDKSRLIRRLVDDGKLSLSKTREAFDIQEIEFEGKNTLFVSGYDGQGLAYALYELAERVSSQSIINLVDPLSAEPALQIREVFNFFNNFHLDSVWFYDPNYWEAYFSLLARNQINTFTLVFGYHNTNFLPFLPHFVSLPEYEEVTVEGISGEELAKNEKALKTITETAADYGIEFYLGIWQFKLDAGSHPFSLFQPGIRLTGLTPENSVEYTYLALKKLIADFPAISGFGIRRGDAEGEKSGLSEEFLLQTLGEVLAENGRDRKLRLLAGDFGQDTVEQLIAKGVPVYLSTKYGHNTLTLSSQPPDLPRDSNREQTRFFHEIWGCGSHRILLWGNPHYLRQLTEELKALGSQGLAVTPPLALKGFGDQPGQWSLLTPEHQYYTWEFERYWYFYTLVGRLSYNPKLPGEVLLREFNRRFGRNGPAIIDLYHLASEVLDIYLKFHDTGNTLESWPEIDTGGALDYYYRRPPADPDLFCSCHEYVNEYLSNKPSGRITPETVAERLENLGRIIVDKVRKELDLNLLRISALSEEWRMTLNDFSILGNLALFHSARIKAAVNLGLYYETADLSVLYQSKQYLCHARRLWEKIVDATTDLYYPWMVTGPLAAGHWAAKLPLLREDERRVETLIKKHLDRGYLEIGFDFGSPPPGGGRENPDPALLGTNYYVEVGYLAVDHRTGYSAEKKYGWIKSAGLIGVSPPVLRLTDQDLAAAGDNQRNSRRASADRLYHDLVMGYNPATFRVDLQPGTYRIRVLLCDRSPRMESHGPMSITLNERVLAEDLFIPTGKEVILTETLEVTDALLVNFESPPEGDWFISALEIIPTVPVIKHSPSKWEHGQPLTVEASVFAQNPVQHVHLYYRLESEDDYKLLPMIQHKSAIYRAEIKEEIRWGTEKVYYYLTASDGKTETALGSKETPYSVRWGSAAQQQLYCYHSVPERITTENGLRLELKVSDPDQVEEVWLYVRRLLPQRQKEEDFLEIPMSATATEVFSVELPNEYLSGAHALLYHFRVITKTKKGFVFPDPFQTKPYYVIYFE